MLRSSPPLRRLFIAHFQSQLGSGAAYVALILIAYQRLHSAWAIALVLLADFLPGIVLAAAFGALADRRPRVHLAVDEQRSPATALYSGLTSFGMTVGPALTALLLLFASPAQVLAANGVTFLLSAALLPGLPLGRASRPAGDAESLWSATRAGARAATEIPGMGPLLVIGAMSVLAGALMNVRKHRLRGRVPGLGRPDRDARRALAVRARG